MQYTQQQRLAPEVPDESTLYSPIDSAVLLESGVSVYSLAFVLEADILSTCRNKDCVM